VIEEEEEKKNDVNEKIIKMTCWRRREKQ